MLVNEINVSASVFQDSRVPVVIPGRDGIGRDDGDPNLNARVGGFHRFDKSECICGA